MEISQPAPLTRLPRAGLDGSGNTRFAQVYGISADGSKKRKRNEVCVATDADSITVHDVRDGRSILSWPVPPDSVFLSECLCDRVRGGGARKKIASNSDDENRGILRRAHVVMKRGVRSSLQTYTAAYASGDGQDEEGRAQGKVSVNSVLLEGTEGKAVTEVSRVSQSVVVTWDDGSVMLIKEPFGSGSDVQRRSISRGTENGKVLASRCMSIADSKESILKSRPDLVVEKVQGSIVLASIFQINSMQGDDQNILELEVWQINENPQIGVKNTNLILRRRLASKPVKQVTTAKFLDSGRISLRDSSQKVVYDISGTIPREVERKQVESMRETSIDVAQGLKVRTKGQKLQLYNSKFNSVVCETVIKRKRESGANTGDNLKAHAGITLIAYFSQLQTVLCQRGLRLMSIELRGITGKQLRQSQTLMGNLLKGVQAVDQRQDQRPFGFQCSIGGIQEILFSAWPDVQEELRGYLDKQDTITFENVYIQKVLKNDEKKSAEKVSSDAINFLLKTVFELNETAAPGQTSSLNVRTILPRLSPWLISQGLFQADSVQRALELPARLDDRIVAAAVSKIGNQGLFESYIRQSPYLAPSVLGLIIKDLLATIIVQSSAQLELENGTSEQDIVIKDSTNDQTDARSDQSMANSNCLSYALRRIAATSATTISVCLKQSLALEHVLTLVQYLRQQLFRGGFTRLADASNYPSPPASDNGMAASATPSTQLSLPIIIAMLNGCIDTLGPIGILGNSEHEVFLQTLLPDLLSEISSATRAVEDSAELQGSLRETLRYIETVEATPFKVQQKYQGQHEQAKHKSGEVVVLYSEPVNDSSAVGRQVLPLGLKSEQQIDREKTRKGDGQKRKRSAREMGMYMDRLKAPYSFERLYL